MKKIKYSYCLNENDELIHISSVNKENRREHSYHCLECGQEMVPKIGKIKVPHFSHIADTACSGESYLHKLAKLRIRKKFMSSNCFPISFSRDVICKDSNCCKCYDNSLCINHNKIFQSDLKKWKDKVIYDTCLEEKRVGEFQPDLLLTLSTNRDRPPVFIEVYKTHESEHRKITSEHRIIETTQIKSEADIDDIIKRGFVEGQNCTTYNFKPKLPPLKKNDVPITRFILYVSGAAKVLHSTDYIVMCDKLNQRVDPKSFRELNLVGFGIEIWGTIEEENKLDSYQTGLIYLVKKGLEIKNCILCRFYKYNEWRGIHVCVLYKSLGEQFHYPKQTTARNCPQYEISQRFINHPLSELEDIVSEVPL